MQSISRMAQKGILDVNREESKAGNDTSAYQVVPPHVSQGETSLILLIAVKRIIKIIRSFVRREYNTKLAAGKEMVSLVRQ